MSRWQKRIDNLLADLERETPGTEGFRININHKISEAETAVSKPLDEEGFAFAENWPPSTARWVVHRSIPN
jgi:hypothetical protein